MPAAAVSMVDQLRCSSVSACLRMLQSAALVEAALGQVPPICRITCWVRSHVSFPSVVWNECFIVGIQVSTADSLGVGVWGVGGEGAVGLPLLPTQTNGLGLASRCLEGIVPPGVCDHRVEVGRWGMDQRRGWPCCYPEP